jgi:diketogulonate reductase-like aldo/keto reductase
MVFVCIAYVSLGGQDCGKKRWNILGGKLTARTDEECKITRRYGKTEAQVLVKWASQQGYVVIPKSTNAKHLRENLDAAVDISWILDDDMSLLDSIDQSKKSFEENVHGVKAVNDLTRLCWVRDPLKMLEFE